ncbi:molybdenum cofactor guanylyltransferase [Thermocrinis minervae]|uniref:Probable molybdenum cofactor guanylyltransferase n=1 Tax=Thermocrinis minervae TaxID=381751 RepID=A0A1M6QF23_9AQUI|nr:molybdenum cofactor guanylyltransferase [Thermocrinis minervae]SHK18796.1 molybdenum cofactor guanylyltransferase [Thermocrinis minervae]
MIPECYILAGGKSRRFGQDKTLYPIEGKPMILHVVELARRVSERVFILSKDVQKYAFIKGVDILKDYVHEQFALAGVYTALKRTSYEKVLILSADMPYLRPDILTHLWKSSQPDVSLYKVNEKLYPFPGVYYRSVLPPLEDYILKGRRRVGKFLELLRINTLTSEEKRAFTNVNTLEDILQAGAEPP